METCLSSERIFEGIVFSVRRDRVRLDNGHESTREVVEHNGGVAVVAIDERDNVTLVKQYRYGAQEELWELPAGKLEKNEDHAACGRRELKEETGQTCTEYVYLGYCLPTCAYDTERIHLYLARGLTEGEKCLDEGEFLETYKKPLDTVVDMIMSGEITDAKTIVGVLKAREYLKRS